MSEWDRIRGRTMTAKRYRIAKGVTLPELVVVMVVTTMIVLIISTLLVASQRQWSNMYAYANTGIEADAVTTMITYGTIGRKSNKNDYVVYRLVGGNYTKVLPPTSDPTSLVTGGAVEFRYWGTDFDGTMLDITKTATAYAFFYLNGHNLTLKQGPYNSTTHIGAIDSGQIVAGSQVKTNILSTRVTSLTFSHDTKNAAGDGDGSVRIEVTFTDPVNNDTLSIKSATLMRNVWP
jgi:hypothetical protein